MKEMDFSIKELFYEVLGELSIEEIVTNKKLMDSGEAVLKLMMF